MIDMERGKRNTWDKNKAWKELQSNFKTIGFDGVDSPEYNGTVI